jgi:hypothetical protein
VIKDRDLYEPQKNHLTGGPINVRRNTNLTQGLEIPMAVTLALRHRGLVPQERTTRFSNSDGVSRLRPRGQLTIEGSLDAKC